MHLFSLIRTAERGPLFQHRETNHNKMSEETQTKTRKHNKNNSKTLSTKQNKGRVPQQITSKVGHVWETYASTRPRKHEIEKKRIPSLTAASWQFTVKNMAMIDNPGADKKKLIQVKVRSAKKNNIRRACPRVHANHESRRIQSTRTKPRIVKTRITLEAFGSCVAKDHRYQNVKRERPRSVRQNC